MKMKSSQTLAIFTFLALVISSAFAHLDFAAQAPAGSGFSASPSASPLGSPEAAPTTTVLDTTSAFGNSALPKIGATLKEWCNSTDYPELCESAIAPYLKGKPDLFGAIEIGIKAAVATTKTAILATTKIANSPVTPQELASLLKDALNSFNDALVNYQEAQNALPQRDWGTVNTMLSGAISDFGDCEDTIKKEDMPILKEFTEKLTKMTSNCLALSALFDPPPGYYL